MENKELDRISALLDKIEIIDFKYQNTRLENQFNVFNVLGKAHDEVNIHSKFIQLLLNPDGIHGKGSLFLQSFLASTGITNFNIEGAKVLREYKGIDILIRNRTQCIIIENKIWASDQNLQLERYYYSIRAEGIQEIQILYLSPFGREAEDYSIGTLASNDDWSHIYAVISYQLTISSWLECCAKECYELPRLRETIIQYKDLIDQIAGKTMNTRERDEVLNLIYQGDNVLKAVKIAENWNHLRWYTEYYFWSELEIVIGKDHSILDTAKFSRDKLDSVIHKSRNKNPWFGIMISAGSYKNLQLFLFLERGVGELSYGIVVEPRESTLSVELDGLAEKLLSIGDSQKTQYWLSGKFPANRINLNSFNTENTLMLANPEFRAKYIQDLWIEMKEYLLQFQVFIEEDKS